MQTTEISNQSAANASKKIDALISIGAGEIVDSALNKLIVYQLAKYRRHIDQVNYELRKFEDSYHMSSEEFYEKFEAGELGDEGDFFEWSSLYENILLYEERIEKLESLATE